MPRCLPSFALCCSLLLVACDGLVPPEPVAGFTGLGGTVRYVGGPQAWPRDSIYNLVVVAFEQRPTSAADILPAVLTGSAIFAGPLPYRVASSTFEMPIGKAPKTYRFIAVGLQDGPSINEDWTMLAVYSGEDGSPDSVVVQPGVRTTVDFTVDFSNLPPQPFE